MTRIRLFGISAVAAALTACASSSITNYDRHSMSRLYPATSGDELIFEASVTPDYPADDPAAEAARNQWISQWLDQRKFCAQGFAIVERERLGSAADNPYQHDLRYRIRCKTSASN